MPFKFENLQVWQKAVDFTVDIRKISAYLPDEEQYGLKSQLNRAAASVALNIAEGAGRFHNKDFIRFLRIAKGSLNEVVTVLRICYCSEMLSEEQHKELYANADELDRMLNGLSRKLT